MALKKIILNGTEIELPSGGGNDFPLLTTSWSDVHRIVLDAYNNNKPLTVIDPYDGYRMVITYFMATDLGFMFQYLYGTFDEFQINTIVGVLENGEYNLSSVLHKSVLEDQLATINGQSLLNGGQDITIEGGGGNVPTKTSELTNDSGFITASDNVASATKLQTMRYINGSPFDGTANAVSYAVCATGASTTAKTVSISRFSLATGSQVRVKFSNANTASAPTLNVGSTGAKRMSYKGSLITNANFSFSTAKIYTFTYDGTYWVLEGDWDEAPKTSILTCEFMGEVGDVIWSDGDDHDRMDYIANWMEALSLGKVCVLDFDEYEGTYAMVHAINYRNDATYGIGKVYFSYVFEGYLYDVEYESVSLPVTLTIVNKTKVESGGNAEPMVCAYTIGSYTARTIELINHTYNGQTMDYREGAIISITNPFNKDVVFEGGTLTLDGNEYEAAAFTLKVGATVLFSLGPDSGVLLPISSVVESNSGGSSEGGSSAYAEVDHGTSDTSFALTPNTFHVWDEVATLDLSLSAETSGVANEYLFQFTSGSTPTTLTLPDDIKFSDDLTIEANKIYQISILKGLGSVLSWDNTTLIENKATYNNGNMMNGATLTFEYPTASEIKLYLNYYSSPYLTIPTGTTTITIDWNEPSPPVPQYFFPSSDDTYIYIIA